MYIATVTQIDSKSILRMFSRIRPDRRIVLTPPERPCALFEQIPIGMRRDILKNPTEAEAKKGNISSSCTLRSDAIGRLHVNK